MTVGIVTWRATVAATWVNSEDSDAAAVMDVVEAAPEVDDAGSSRSSLSRKAVVPADQPMPLPTARQLYRGSNSRRVPAASGCSRPASSSGRGRWMISVSWAAAMG